MSTSALSIICVDDDSICLDHLKNEMKDLGGGFSVCYCQSPEAALLAHEDRPAEIVISDLRMGATSGIELIGKMIKVSSETLYVLLSGQADLKAALAALNDLKVFQFLEKPARRDQLKLMLDSAVTELNLRKLRSLSMVSHSAMSALRNGVIFLNERLQIIYSNKEADRIIRTARVFGSDHDSVFRSCSPKQTTEFQEFLHQLADGVSEDQRSIFRFERPDSTIPITVSVVFHPNADGIPAYYSMIVADAMDTRTTPASIAAALNILPSEARVVSAIADGLSLEEAAALAGVSIHTARSYLKSAFQKTGVSRQAELVRLALLTAA